MKAFRPTHMILAAMLAVAPAVVAAQAPDPRLTGVLAQLDAASKRFTNARANFVSENYESVVKEVTMVQTGITYVERNKGALEMGMVVMSPKKSPTEKDKPDKILEYKNAAGRMFDLSVDQIRLMKADKQGMAQTFLTLGFGGSGQDLARSWNITYLGSETLKDGNLSVKTEKLDLVSKDENVRSNYSHITIWIDPERDVSLRQVFETPAHDRRTVNNSHIVLNGKINKAEFAIKPDSNTKIIP